MSQHNAVRVDELGWASPPLKERLLRDPVQVLAERGIRLPAGLPRAVVYGAARVALLLWVEGEILSIDRFYIDPGDEGLLFGRGVWESTRTINGQPWLWELHIERLLHTAELLGIPIEASRLPDTSQVSEYVHRLAAQEVIVRLNVTAGRAGQGGRVWMSAALPPALASRSVCRAGKHQSRRNSPTWPGRPSSMPAGCGPASRRARPALIAP